MNNWIAGLPVTLVARRTQGGVTTATKFVYGLGLISTTDNVGVASYYLADGLGTTTQMVSSSGAVTDTYTYDVFGAPRTTGNSSPAPGFSWTPDWGTLCPTRRCS